MTHRIVPYLAGLLLMCVVPRSAEVQEVTSNLTEDPAEAPFVFTDVENFVAAHKKLAAGVDTIAILQNEYLDKGTPGLRMFIEKYWLSAEKLAAAIGKHPEKYASLGDMPDLLQEESHLYRRAYAALKLVLPDAVYPPTYFLIGAYRGIGSGSVEGQLITVEKWNRPLDEKRPLLVHELVHFQQVVAVGYEKYKALFGSEKSLLGLCIREGTAEFFADLVTGEITQDEALDYTIQNEKRLWDWFQKEMQGEETGDWMWKKPKDPDQPRHVGYVMGYRIVASYYNNAEEKAQAVREILSVTDYPDFLKKSGYAAKFADRQEGQ